jgi:hypothetical protein
MRDDRIRNLLQQVDRITGPPGLVTDLSKRVHRIHRRRRVTAAALSVTAGIILVTGLIFVARHFMSESSAPVPPGGIVQHTTDTQTQIDQLRAEIAQLRAEADAREQIIRGILEYQQQQARWAAAERQFATQPDPLEEIIRQRERAALIILYHADRKYNEPNLRESALTDYHQLIQLFPDTRWAEAARKRLAEIQNNKGETL